MKSINKFFSSVAEVCSPSKGNLSGAMDVIVIKRPDGTLASTPFYIKFGRLKLMKSNKIKVNLVINSTVADMKMELKKSGKAVFIRDPLPTLKPENYSEDSKITIEFSEEKKIPQQIIKAPLLARKNSALSDDGVPSNNEGIELLTPYTCNDVYKNQRFSRSISPIFHKSHHLHDEKSSVSSSEGRESLRLYRMNSGVILPLNNLTSEELEQLNLKPGLNIVSYVTETKKKAELTGRIFL